MSNKKEIRTNFRNRVFKRDKYTCRVCCYQSTPEKAIEELDAHHIINRNLMTNGGYVLENGISLCKDCHLKAEKGEISKELLFECIGSSESIARKQSLLSNW